MIWKEVLNNVWPYIRNFKAKAIIAVVLSFVLALLGGAQVRLVRPLFDKGLSPDATNQEVLILVGMLLGIGLLHFPARFFHFYLIRFVVDRATCLVREDLFRKFQKLPLSFFSKSKQGELISQVMNDTAIFAQGFRAIIDLLREPLKASVFLGMAFWSDWQLALVIIAISPFLVGIFSLTGKRVKGYQGVVQEKIAGLTHNVTEGLSAQKISKAFNLENFIKGRFVKSQDDFFYSQMKTTKVEEVAHPLVEIIGTFAFCGVIYFAHYRIKAGALTVGEFVSFIAALALFMDPIRKFSQANIRLSQAAAAGKRIFHLLQTPNEIDNGEHKPVQFEKSIEIKNLKFGYGEEDILKGVSFEILKGQKVALVGLSGSGKTTIINLLLGLYPVEKNQILIDGKDVNDIKLFNLRGLSGLVSQDIFLFNDSVRNNLCLGESFSDEQLNEALKVAYAYDFVQELEDGLDTVIGDRGMRLSGGQKQRITIARAFLHDAPILLFDEATSALDNESEKVVQKALESVAGDKTVIAVAHRLTTVQDYDKIYVMKQGKITEDGKHEDLLALNGEYAKLYELSGN